MPRTLDRQAVRRFYDRFGSKHDRQSFHEDPGLDVLVREGYFAHARHVFELGCGTGRFADRLLSRELPPDTRHEGVDLSSTMVDLATRRLSRFPGRAKVTRTEGDLLFDPRPRNVHPRHPRRGTNRPFTGRGTPPSPPGGHLCTLALTHGCSVPSRLLSRAWSGVYSCARASSGDVQLWVDRRPGAEVFVKCRRWRSHPSGVRWYRRPASRERDR